jgi:hypothetical protein
MLHTHQRNFSGTGTRRGTALFRAETANAEPMASELLKKENGRNSVRRRKLSIALRGDQS